MTVELTKIFESKRAARRDLSSKPVGEKLRIVEELAERALATRRDTSAEVPLEPWQIPPTWQWQRMGDVAKIVGGGTPRTDHPEYFGGDIPWITPADLSRHTQKTISRGSRSITFDGLVRSGAQLLPEGTVLFSSRAPIGYVAIAANPVTTNQGFKSFVLGEGVYPDYVYYYLQHARKLAVALASGTTFLEISGKNAARLPIPLPPIAEQHRIVAEIEKQLTRLEAGIAGLESAQTRLSRFRLTLLTVACEGRFVNNLNSRQRGSDHASWAGEPSAFALPAGWTWVTLDDVCSKITDGEHISPRMLNEGIKLLSAKDVREQGIKLDEPRFVSEDDAARFRKRCDPEKGDVLVVSRGATIGRVSLVQVDEIFCLMGSVILLKPARNILGKFLSICLMERRARHLLGLISGSTAQQAIYIRDIRRLTIPLPPLLEQHRIVAEVERQLSAVDNLANVVTANRQRTKRLRQSILQRAFSGDL